jgi:hypothetical protein
MKARQLKYKFVENGQLKYAETACFTDNKIFDKKLKELIERVDVEEVIEVKVLIHKQLS